MTEFYDQEHIKQPLRAVPDPADSTEDLGDVEIDLTADPYSVPAVQEHLDQAIEEITAARTVPMSATVRVNRDELLDLLELAKGQLPEELRRARWLLKEKAEFLETAKRERDEIIDQGRQEVAQMVERQQIVQSAEAKARQVMEEARAESRQMKRQTEDFCDQKLATFEVLLERTANTIQQGREKLLGSAGGDSDQSAQASMPPPPTPSDALSGTGST